MKVGAIGDNCMDVYTQSGQAFPGGNPVNVAVYTMRLGGNASYVGAVGTDAYGDAMITALSEKGVDVSHLRREEGTTAVTEVSLRDGDRVFGDYTEGVMEFFRPSAGDIDFLATHDLVVSGLWGHAESAFPVLQARGIPVAFDCADTPDHPTALIALPHVDYAFFSADGDDEAVRTAMMAVYAQGPRLVVATRGERGSMAYDGAAFYEQGIVACPVVDTMGAGDSFIAGALFGLMRGWSLQECMAHGAACSSVTIGYRGAW